MKTIFRHRVRFFSIALGYLLFFVAALMALVMNTALDRVNYITLFSNPFENSRIEIGFQYYMKLFALLGAPPDVAIVITCVIIYLLMAWVWFERVNISWLESILLFNFFTFSLFNYYLGTSIRMGLATAFALYAAMCVMRGNNFFLIALWASPLVHYGTMPFVLTFTWVLATRNLSWRLHKFFILSASIALPISVGLILRVLGLDEYYLAYFTEMKGQTERIFPFTFAFFIFALSLSSFKGEDSIDRRLAFYGLPFLLYGVISGIGIFSKMLIPNIFIAAMVITVEYRNIYVQNINPELRMFLSTSLNFLAVIFALRAYQYL